MNTNTRRYFVSSSNLFHNNVGDDQILLIGHNVTRNFSLSIKDIVISGLSHFENLVYIVIQGITNNRITNIMRNGECNNNIVISLIKTNKNTISLNGMIYSGHYDAQNIEYLRISLEYENGVKVPVLNNAIKYNFTLEITEFS